MAEVRARLGEPEAMIEAKIGDHVDRHARRFIAHSPFLTPPPTPRAAPTAHPAATTPAS